MDGAPRRRRPPYCLRFPYASAGIKEELTQRLTIVTQLKHINENRRLRSTLAYVYQCYVGSPAGRLMACTSIKLPSLDHTMYGHNTRRIKAASRHDERGTPKSEMKA